MALVAEEEKEEQKPLLDTQTVASRLGVSVRTVTRLAENGDLVGLRVTDLWRFEESDLRDYILKQKQQAQEKAGKKRERGKVPRKQKSPE